MIYLGFTPIVILSEAKNPSSIREKRSFASLRMTAKKFMATTVKKLQELSRLVRYFILKSTTAAGSGHPTSSLSATDLMTALMFGGFFHADLDNPANPNNDRLIFSKGHASPLLYSLYAVAGKVGEEELMTLRKFGSPLEGHPMMEFPYTEAATGSLGQGLSVGVGMALNAKLDNLNYKTFVLLGDSEMAEGSNWEALELAAHYKLNNLIGILDVNRLGQRGETMYGYDVKNYAKRIGAFGWETVVIDGHDFGEIAKAFKRAASPHPLSLSLGERVREFPSPQGEGRGVRSGRPMMIIAKTVKGKGVSFLENKEGWHGRVLSADELKKALAELGKVNTELRGVVAGAMKTERLKDYKIGDNRSSISNTNYKLQITNYKLGDKVATRKAYGNALVNISPKHPNLVVLDAEVSNSTYAEIFKKVYPERFLEMYIAEQNMVGAALGLSRRGKIPFVSTFSAFFTRAFDQIRMSQYSQSNVKFVGSHAGVSIGEDGPSQMGLEDIAMFRAANAVVLYPSDAVSTEKLVEEAAKHVGNVYIRTTRKETPVLYSSSEQFTIGGSKTLRSSSNDVVTVVTAGITLFEALKACEELKKEGISIRVIDMYSIRPLDMAAFEKAAKETKAIITVEDHYAQGGLGEAVATALSEIGNMKYEIRKLAVRKMPKSGKPDELLAYEEIDAAAIIKKVREII